MGQKDLAQNDYFNDKVRFADVFNGVFFDGKQVVKEEELEPFVTNYRLNLFDYHNYDDFSMFKTKNRLLFETLSNAEDEEAIRNLMLGNKEEYGHLDYDTAKTICDIAGIKINLDRIKNEDKEEYNMCKAWDDHKEAGRREGRQEGRREGVLENRVESIQNLMKNLSVTVEQAMELLGIPQSEREKCMKKL